MLRLSRAAVGLALLLAMTAGCGKNTVTVSGTVTWEGDGKPQEPLKDGRIQFEPEEGGVPVSGEIKAGKYRVEVPPGKKKVLIHANREKPGAKVDAAMGAVPREQYVPKWYNDQTKLRAEIPAKGSVELPPFDLRQKE